MDSEDRSYAYQDEDRMDAVIVVAVRLAVIVVAIVICAAIFVVAT